jgi:tetratricopeptide (TPR) repeat protein
MRRCKLPTMRRAALGVLIVMSACAPAMTPAPIVTTPKFPDFITPAVPPEFASTPAAINESRGWAFLQSGDLRTAEHEFTAALKNDPRFYPAVTSLGYLDLARKDPKAALAQFDRALEQQRTEVGALFGRGQALLALERDSDAMSAFESVLAVDPNQAEARRRVDVLKFRVLEQEIAHAREAAAAGRLDEAAHAYGTAIAGQPDSAFLYRELAIVDERQGREETALEHFRRAVELDASDARSLMHIGGILENRSDFEAATQAYESAAALDPNPEVEKKLEALRNRAALEKLPAEYRAIGQASQVTRADLAALMGIRLGPLLQNAPSGDAGFITDIRSNWAQTWIVAVARAGVMEPFANHAFQPRAIVRRADLAQATAKLLTIIGASRPAAAKAWESARPRFSDLVPTHLAYPAASIAVGADVLQVGPGDTFQPSRAITGAEAVEAVGKLETLAGLK